MIEIALIMFAIFTVLMVLGVSIGVALGLAGTAAIALANWDAPLFGLMAIPQNFYAGIAKYPLLAIPMFVLVGSIFDRSGVAARLVNLAVSIFGRGPGVLPAVAIMVAMFLGGISGSGPACAAAVGGVMVVAMRNAGYPPAFNATVIGAAASTDILIPPSVAFIIYSVLVPGASVPALFAAGVIPGILVGIGLIVPAVWLSRRHGMGRGEADLPRPPFWRSLRQATWGIAAPILILGGMRAGWFTPTEAAVVAVYYGLFVGMAVYRTIRFHDLFEIFREAAELSAIILLVVALASIFAYSLSTLSVIDPMARAIAASGLHEYVIMAGIMVLLVIFGMFLDGISLFLIFVPLLVPIAMVFGWDLVWFGVLMTLNVALGQFTPPLAVNLMVSCRMAGVHMQATMPWVGWFLLSVLAVMAMVVIWPDLALWMPRYLGY